MCIGAFAECNTGVSVSMSFWMQNDTALKTVRTLVTDTGVTDTVVTDNLMLARLFGTVGGHIIVGPSLEQYRQRPDTGFSIKCFAWLRGCFVMHSV